MRVRKPQQQLPPVAQIAEPTEVQAARAIAVAINQGLPGFMFARLMNTVDPQPVVIAAGMTLDEVRGWFTANEGARYILEALPAWPRFSEAFHSEAHKIYPTAPRFEPGQ